jgi:HTH-type transcriptional regulator / antitoxin HigA
MTVNVSDKIYGQLLMQVLPSAIQNDEELARLTNEVDRLMTKGIKDDDLSPEETRLLETLAILIEAYEDEHYPIEPCPPDRMLKMLMAENNYRQKDLLHIFGSSGIASEVINGKRSISKAHAKKLAEFFNVSVELFI